MDEVETGLLGGPERVAIVIVAYDPAWPRRFAEERTRIVGALGDRALAVDHIGSTAVPGLAAKPIVDLCLTVVASSDERSYLGPLEEAGYQLRVREPDRFEHRMLRTATRDVHVHVFSAGCPEIERYLRFRDRLRADEADRAHYEATKRRLAARDWPSMDAYARAKAEVVESILARASLGCSEQEIPAQPRPLEE